MRFERSARGGYRAANLETRFRRYRDLLVSHHFRHFKRRQARRRKQRRQNLLAILIRRDERTVAPQMLNPFVRRVFRQRGGRRLCKDQSSGRCHYNVGKWQALLAPPQKSRHFPIVLAAAAHLESEIPRAAIVPSERRKVVRRAAESQKEPARARRHAHNRTGKRMFELRLSRNLSAIPSV